MKPLKLPFRDIENCFMAGVVSGALKRITIEAVKAVKASMSGALSASGVSKDVMILLEEWMLFLILQQTWH